MVLPGFYGHNMHVYRPYAAVLYLKDGYKVHYLCNSLTNTVNITSLYSVEETSRSAAWLTFRSLQQFVQNLAFLARSGNKMSLFGYLY